ncbi:MAG: MMPL family transporter [Caryophanon sp.]|nr:MMPL family transporter [Caryophanon sp.]
MSKPLQKFSESVSGKKSRWVVLSLWLIAIVILTILFPQVNGMENQTGDDLPEYSEARQASELIAEKFPSDSGIPLLIVWQKDYGLTPQHLKDIQTLYANLEQNPLDGQSTLPPYHRMPLQVMYDGVSENRTSLVTPIFFDSDTNTETLKENLAVIAEEVESITGDNAFEESTNSNELTARFSGPVGISVDATDLFKSADFKLMAATVILILVLLLVIYRSPILAVVPIIVVGIAYLVISPALGAFVEQGWITKDAQAIAIMLVLLFGAGTDYCLFLITRYRDILLEEENKFVALSKAFVQSSGAIFMSAATVMVGLATLALADYGAFQRFAVPFSFAVIIMGIAVLTVLPALLSLMGRFAFWPVVPRTEAGAIAHAEKKNKPVKARKENHRFMRKIGRFATNRPWLVILTTGIVLIVLAFYSTQIKYSYDLLSSFPEDIQSREGFAIIEENFTPGELAPVQVLVDTDGERNVDITRALEDLSYVEIVKEMRVSEVDSNLQLYELDLNKNPYNQDAMDDVRNLREKLPAMLEDEGIDNAEDAFWVGGETANQVDTADVQMRDESVIQPVMIVIIALILLVYLRAFFTTLQLMVTVVISFFAALGAGWLILHNFFGADAIASSIPLYSFVFIIALGNDYNIFMISDIWKARKSGASLKDSIVAGVAQTGAVITSAGLILAGTFAVLATLPIQLLVQFGVVTAIGVLLDTFIVRPLLVPAITVVLGRWAYWPGKLFKKED